MKQCAFTETRCDLLRTSPRRSWWQMCSKRAVSFLLFLLFEKRLVALPEEYFLSTCLFFVSPEEATDESWPGNRNHTGAELGQSLNKQVLFFRNGWKHPFPLLLGWNCLPCSTMPVETYTPGAQARQRCFWQLGEQPQCFKSSMSALLPWLHTSPLLPLCFLLVVIYWAGFCGCFLAECS